MRYPDLPEASSAYLAADDDYDYDYDISDERNLGGFIELFYLWCATYAVRETSMSQFELSSTRLVAC
jgi:hypothetical protein